MSRLLAAPDLATTAGPRPCGCAPIASETRPATYVEVMDTDLPHLDLAPRRAARDGLVPTGER